MSSEPARRGVCLVVSAPSGAGKSSLVEAVLAVEPALSVSVSATTRPARAGERDGVHYHFTDAAGFERMVGEGAMLEHATVFGRRYGTPRRPVMEALEAGRDVAFDIDWQGHRQLRAALPADVVSVFVLPPSMAVLERRLRERATDEAGEIRRRMDAAREEMAHWAEFDHILVNSEFERAVGEVRAILVAARSARARQVRMAEFVTGLGE